MTFRGWRSEALEFFDGLEADNSKTFWAGHKAVYEELVLAPMRALLAELEPEFGAGKIFRPYRDVRLSADKSPYKTAIAATVHDGGYIQLSAKGLAVGAGMYVMEPDQLARYRQAAADDRSGRTLEKIIADAAKDQIGIAGHDQLKTAPRGYSADHPRVELLRYKGLVAWREWPPAGWLGTAAARRRVVDFFHASGPLLAWLDTHVGIQR